MISKIKDLTEKGLSIREISEIIGISKTKIGDIRKSNGFEKAKLTLNNEQKQVLLGTVIGDGSIFRSTPNSQCRMNLAHSLKQEEYFLYKYEILKDLIRSEYKKRTWLDKRTNKEYSEIKFQTRVNKLFTDLHDIWYRDGKKIIPKDEIDKCDELCLAIKYFDDGYKHHNGYCISMNDYDNQSIENFTEWMLSKFGIKTTVWNTKVIYIPKEFCEKFKSLVSIVSCKDVQYKL